MLVFFFVSQQHFLLNHGFFAQNWEMLQLLWFPRNAFPFLALTYYYSTLKRECRPIHVVDDFTWLSWIGLILLLLGFITSLLGLYACSQLHIQFGFAL